VFVRDFLLALSENRTLTGLIARIGPFSRLALRFVAGETLPEAIEKIRALNDRGILVTIDHLGENVTDERGAEEATEACLQILEAIRAERLRANISVKLTQLGLDIDLEFCRKNLHRVAERALEHDNFVRIDMESSEYTDRTLDIFRSAYETYGNVGIVIQAYLYRSGKDIEEINAMGARVRLCKGAYREPKAVAFPSKREVDANFLRLTGQLLDSGTYPAIATHDERMIEATKRMAVEKGRTQDGFEFQMLYGIRRDLQVGLVQEGYAVRVYTAYGKMWAPYFMRRLAERPANVFFLLKNLLRDR
jgi:proline dehydrogenase